MKRAIQILILTMLFAVAALGQSPAQCRVTKTFYTLAGQPDRNATLTVYQIRLGGAGNPAYTSGRLVLRTDSQGRLLGADGVTVGVDLPQGAMVWLYSGANAQLPQLAANPNAGTQYQVPAKSAAALEELSWQLATIKAKGALLVGGVNGFASQFTPCADGQTIVWDASQTLGTKCQSVSGALGYTPVNRAGDTLTGALTLAGAPTLSLHAASKGYVDGLATMQSFAARTGAVTPQTGDYSFSQISGTLGAGQFPATLPAIDGSAITNLSAGNLGSGTVPLARISGLTDTQIAAGAGIAQSKIASLTTDLAAKAPLASPSFTGTVTQTATGAAVWAVGPTGATNPTAFLDTTNGGFTLGRSFANGAARVLNFQTQDMNFPIEQFAGKSDFGSGQIDVSWSIQFNRNGVSPLHPRWGENIENFFVTSGGSPERLIEKNWDYTSIDGLTSYRPFNFNVNIDSHDAEMFWRLGKFRVASRNGSDYNFEVLTGALPVIAARGRFSVEGLSGVYNTAIMSVTGNPGTSSFAVFAPTAIASGSAAFALNLPVTSGYSYDTFVIQGQANSGDLQFQQKNNGTGGSRLLVQGGSGGDAYARFLLSGGADWSFGADRSDSGAFVISNGDTPGTNNRVRITTAGAVSIPGSLTVSGGCAGCGFAGTVTTGTVPYVSGANTLADSPIVRTAAETVRVGTGLVLTGALAGDLNYFGIRNANLADTFAATGFTQTSSGDSFVNAAPGRSLYLRIGNGNYFVMSASGGYVFQNGNVKATDGDLAATTSAKGLVLKSPDGTCYRFTVANGGGLSAGASVTCP